MYWVKLYSRETKYRWNVFKTYVKYTFDKRRVFSTFFFKITIVSMVKNVEEDKTYLTTINIDYIRNGFPYSFSIALEWASELKR